MYNITLSIQSQKFRKLAISLDSGAGARVYIKVWAGANQNF